jgi:hypothetical protein
MLATSSGTSYWHPYQKVEVEDWMQGRTFTMSAWVRTTSPSNYFRYCDTVSCSTIGELIPNDGEWHYMTATYTTATTMSIGSSMQFQPVFPSYPYAGVQSGEFCEFALCQLELGSVATEFEHRSYGEELPLCQRYYQSLQIKKGVVGLGQNYQSRGQIGAFSLMTTMRVAPSISSNPTQISVDGGDGSHAFVFQSSKDSFHGYVDMGTGNVAGVTYSGDTHSAFTASIDAEL